MEEDRKEAQKVQQAGCPYCGGTLHYANYPRHPKGFVPCLETSDLRKQFSFCCKKCRKRVTPPTLRFFANKVYSAPFILGVLNYFCSLAQGEIQSMLESYSISRRTLNRWLLWFSKSNEFDQVRIQTKSRVLLEHHQSSFFLESLFLIYENHKAPLDCLVKVLKFIAYNLKSIPP